MSALEKLDFTSAHVIQRAAFVTRTHRVSDGLARACFWQYCPNRLVVIMRTDGNMSFRHSWPAILRKASGLVNGMRPNSPTRRKRHPDETRRHLLGEPGTRVPA